MNILAAKAIHNLVGNSSRKYIEELFNIELMHLFRQMQQNYVPERRFCVSPKVNFVPEYVRRRGLDTLVRTCNVTDSWKDDKNTHRDVSRTNCSFMSEPSATHKQGTEILCSCLHRPSCHSNVNVFQIPDHNTVERTVGKDYNTRFGPRRINPFQTNMAKLEANRRSLPRDDNLVDTVCKMITWWTRCAR
jgi:hypothetical protein